MRLSWLAPVMALDVVALAAEKRGGGGGRMSEATAAAPLPAGVLGYVVACAASKTVLTHSSLMDRETAEREAGQWRRHSGRLGGRYMVCEVRETSG